MRVVTVGASHPRWRHLWIRPVTKRRSLVDPTFTVEPNDYTIDVISVLSKAGASIDGKFGMSLTSALTAADRAKLVLHVDGGSDSFAFSAAEENAATHDYEWDNSGLDWSSEDFVTLRLRGSAPLSMDATLSGLAVNDGSKNLDLTPAFAPNMDAYTRRWGALWPR